MDIAGLIIGILIGVALGAVIGVLVTRGRAMTAEARVDELRQAQTQAELRGSGDARILQELAPMRSELSRLRVTVRELEQERLELHGRLSEQLRVQASSDAELRAATEQLTAAMRSGTARGNWGEAQLRNLFESAGMLPHVDFDTQVSVNGDDGVLRPDAVVHLPGEHALVIDAKAPMTRFLEGMRVPQPGTEADAKLRSRLLREHAQAVRGHVDTLRARNYQAVVVGSPNFVVAYLPSEAALSAAVTADPALLDDAFAKGVALASPTTLWAILRSIAAAWQQERVSESVEQVLALSSDLYRRIGTASGHLAKLGRQLRGSVEAYDQFVGSYESRVLPTARRLAEFDAAAKPIETPKSVEKTPRAVTAPELVPDAEVEPEHR
ncbi:DNA recombination protein RmuC [Gulosibacter sp. ACHW.36C]|uniref:DNA recombination protein RmuC n=1 Tax=Gulosibacter sediminis TaxID=1729695 RepID=A0ABY4MZA5_9MICO|nr:DNA recombination protein RmuC [Gulosibacter sediminis]UQN15766.1 DNA recombination protein RmuC [Gulosibacter sediminis]